MTDFSPTDFLYVARNTFKKGFKISSLNFSELKIAPPIVLPWPSICLVPEYTMISAPNFDGFCKTGDTKILSTTTLILFF